MRVRAVRVQPPSPRSSGRGAGRRRRRRGAGAQRGCAARAGAGGAAGAHRVRTRRSWDAHACAHAPGLTALARGVREVYTRERERDARGVIRRDFASATRTVHQPSDCRDHSSDLLPRWPSARARRWRAARSPPHWTRNARWTSWRWFLPAGATTRAPCLRVAPCRDAACAAPCCRYATSRRSNRAPERASVRGRAAADAGAPDAGHGERVQRTL